ncbi:ribosome assembly RNA-binding protein YhbY [Calderihabitans maritimus]|uniref:RNA-binding protein n=1 Tax=Calderihabitans maritimus TaxID=1246530 RepID=A0A1Z5HVA6_9FIRM|nr:ribosome assembly RNA-binding protein YhbY [Calderihabitans maritimus]GAW93338.1 RNA-binding protein [Calderihabitans maritimus]
MLTGKQRRFLRAMGTGLDPILQVGKGGITEALLKQVDEALEARELIKIRILPNSGREPKEVGKNLAVQTGAELVQVIGRNLLLYRRSQKKPTIELP